LLGTIALLLAIFVIVFGFYGFTNENTVEQSVEIEASKNPETIQQQLEDVKEFKYYLDKGDEAIADKMQQMDLVIIEPVEMQSDYITSAQESGTLVYGYINAMEADKWNKDLYQQFNENDFYTDENGERMYFEEWDSYMMDMTSPHYQDVLLAEIEKQVVNKELDGVFLDTVGNIDSYLPESEQEEQNQAMQDFMKKIKKQFDGLSIAQNWGFDTLVNYTAPYVDFIMWEDYSYRVVGEDEWALFKMEQLKQVRDEYGTQIMAIAFSDPNESKDLADMNGFKFLYNPAGSYYNEWE